MKIIGYYNKHNNEFYGYVTSNEYIIRKDIRDVSPFNKYTYWVKNFGEKRLSMLFKLKKSGLDQENYINEMFKYSNIEDVEVRVLDFEQVVKQFNRKQKLIKIKNR